MISQAVAPFILAQLFVPRGVRFIKHRTNFQVISQRILLHAGPRKPRFGSVHTGGLNAALVATTARPHEFTMLEEMASV